MDLVSEAIAAITQAIADHDPAVVRLSKAVETDAPELLVIVDAAPIAAIRALADAAAPSMARGARLRVLTREEIEQAADVFTLELAEYVERGELVHGRDPFAQLRLDPAALRRSLEQATRGLIRRLRNRVLAGVATRGARDLPDQAIAEALTRTCALTRHGLALLGHASDERDDDGELEQLGRVLDVELSSARALLARVRAGEELDDPFAAVEILMTVLEPLARAIDRLAEPDA